jgi:hypothetical protein
MHAAEWMSKSSPEWMSKSSPKSFSHGPRTVGEKIRVAGSAGSVVYADDLDIIPLFSNYNRYIS